MLTFKKLWENKIKDVFPLYTSEDYEAMKMVCDVGKMQNGILKDTYERSRNELFNETKPVKRFHKAQRDGAYKFRRYSTYAKLTNNEMSEYDAYVNKHICSTMKFPEDIIWKISNYIDNFPQRYVRESLDTWSTPAELMKQLIKGKLIGDCDDTALVKYFLMRSALSDYEGEFQHVRLAHVNFYGHKKEGHLNLMCVRELQYNVFDWVFMESTIWKDRNKIFWNNPVRYQNNYDVVCSFDDETEYSLK